jgi:hypothetical protein
MAQRGRKSEPSMIKREVGDDRQQLRMQDKGRSAPRSELGSAEKRRTIAPAHGDDCLPEGGTSVLTTSRPAALNAGGVKNPGGQQTSSPEMQFPGTAVHFATSGVPLARASTTAASTAAPPGSA